jgi:hypothetical protein
MKPYTLIMECLKVTERNVEEHFMILNLSIKLLKFLTGYRSLGHP